MTTIKTWKHTLLHLNLHNSCFGAAGTKKVCDWLRATGERVRGEPLRFVGITTGDWNFLDNDKTSTSLSSLTAVTLSPSATNSREISAALALFTEFSTSEDTHYIRAEGCTSCLDRTYVACPTYVLTNSRIFSQVLDDPTALSAVRISDHAATIIVASLKPPASKSAKPIPNSVCKRPKFIELHSHYIVAAELDELDPINGYHLHEQIISECAARARDYILEQKELTAQFSTMSLATAARLVLYNKVSLAEKLIRKSETIARHVVVSSGSVIFTDHLRFENEFALEKARCCERELKVINEIIYLEGPGDSRLLMRASKLDEKSKLWRSGIMKIVLDALELPDGTIVSKPEEITDSMMEAWQPIFQKKGSRLRVLQAIRSRPFRTMVLHPSSRIAGVLQLRDPLQAQLPWRRLPSIQCMGN